MKRNVKIIVVLALLLLATTALLGACDVSALTHKHTLTHVAAVEPTCTEEGTK